MENEKIIRKPIDCPFCGSDLVWFEHDCIACRKCGCDGPLIVDKPDEDTAVGAWNTRLGTSHNGYSAIKWYGLYCDEVTQHKQTEETANELLDALREIADLPGNRSDGASMIARKAIEKAGGTL